jgi:hypothetical protein
MGDVLQGIFDARSRLGSIGNGYEHRGYYMPDLLPARVGFQPVLAKQVIGVVY